MQTPGLGRPGNRIETKALVSGVFLHPIVVGLDCLANMSVFVQLLCKCLGIEHLVIPEADHDFIDFMRTYTLNKPRRVNIH